MSRIKLAVTLAVLLLVIAQGQRNNAAIANFTPYDVFLPDIVIRSDGSVAPDTGFINHTGNVYTLTGDLSNYSLVVQCSNITIDGKGHTINGSQPDTYETVNEGLLLDHVASVTVKDLEIVGFNDFESVRLINCSECMIVRVKTPSISLQNGHRNIIAQSAIDHSMDIGNSHNNTVLKNVVGSLLLSVSHNTLVTENNITSIVVQFCDSNRYFRNNFLSPNNSFQYYFSNKVSLWDNGSVGNYWSDYLIRFPNASEIDASGIGNTPYEINQVRTAWINGELVNVTWIPGYIIDHYPLMTPVDCFAPGIKILTLSDSLYERSTIVFNFTIDEIVSQIAYSLDEVENVTISGNTTLSGLANGDHDLTLYAWDMAGNVGASETVHFSVDVPFPITLVVAASGSIFAIAVGLTVYFKKLKIEKQD